MRAVKAIDAWRMAFRSDGKHKAGLDKVSKTRVRHRPRHADKYKETSCGGLAVNVIAC